MTKPAKPTADFPLYAHASGKWAKKINGRIHYFGRWDDPSGALREYRQLLGEQKQGGFRDLLNEFLHHQRARTDRGELAERSYKEYRSTCRILAQHFGDNHAPHISREEWRDYHTARSKKRNPLSMGNEIVRIKTIWKWLRESKYVPEAEFPNDFCKAPARVLRKLKRDRGKRMFTAEQVRRLLNEAGVHLRAMIFLAVNCGYGPTDCALVPLSALQDGWMEFARPKTEIDRRCPLWPEAQDALAQSIAARPKSDRPELFLRYSGMPWNLKDASQLTKRFRAVREAAELTDGSFYDLRRTFATIASGAKDPEATSCIMGHVDSSMAGVYRQLVDDDRLMAVTNQVRAWLLA